MGEKKDNKQENNNINSIKSIDLSIYLDNIFNDVDSNIKLDDEQKEAVLCRDKKQLIVAGAGSGKTTVLAAKAKYLVEIEKINAEDILIISFTNKAVNELKDRINNQMKINCDIKTFHQFGLDIIREEEKSIKICAKSSEIIKKIIYKRNNKHIKEFYCMYKKTNIIKKLLIKINLFWRLEKSEEKEFVEFLNLVINKNKNKELDNSQSKIKMIIDKITVQYNEQLLKDKSIDYIDMIVKSDNIINNINDFDYKYIIIDEYQDISYSRHLLIYNIINKFNVTLIAVGDDWQSIYAFSGSKIDLFTNFKNIYTGAKIMKITKTYRNSQELIDIAGNFIMKNNKQIKKNLASLKHLDNPIKIVYYKNNNNMINKFKSIIIEIKELNPHAKILVLGRYTFDVYKIIDNKTIIIKENELIMDNKYKMTYMTVHSSKGLGYDYVILINCCSGKFGFPSEKEDHNILKEIITKEEEEQLNEERRLFYVALTRTKNEVYLLVPKKNESIFVKEIKKDQVMN